MNAILIDSNLSLNIGVDFTQQEWGKGSVVDGVISQDSFKVAIETKLYDNFSHDQLVRHLESLKGNHSQKVLLALSKSKVDHSTREKVLNALKNEKYKDIKFASTTYEDLYQIILSNLSEFDLDMLEVLNDYFSLCHEEGLTNTKNRTLLVFTAGESLQENLKYGIYYDPVLRNHNSPFKYLGLYNNKAIRAIGEVTKIVPCDYIDGKLVGTQGYDINKLSTNEYNRIKETIENTSYYDLKLGIKFFLVDKFYKTNSPKASFGGIRAKKYFWLNETEGFKEGMTAEELAKLFDKKSWG